MSLKKVISRGLICFFLFTLFILEVFGQNNNSSELPEEAHACMADSIKLDPGPAYISYEWSTGDTTQFIWVDINGPYTVILISNTDTVTDAVFVSLVDAEILYDDTTITCPDTIMLKGSSYFFDYIWSTTFALEDTLGTDDSVYVYPRDSSYIYSKIEDPDLEEIYCIDSAKLNVQSTINVDSLEQWMIACPDINNAAVRFEVSGGLPPYMYDCTEGIIYNDTATPYVDILKLMDGNKVLTITDTIGCLLNYSFEVEAYPLPEIDLYSEPSDTVFLQKPYVDFYYDNISYDSLLVDTFELTSLIWYLEAPIDTNAQSNYSSPSHTYVQTGIYDVVFQYYTFYGCKGTDTIRMVVEPVKLSMSPVITPNGDDANDYFEIVEDDTGDGENGGEVFKSIQEYDPIDLSKYYISTKLVVFNRYGQKVYEVDNYENDWDGGGLNDGIYFYVFECHGEYEDKVYKGSVMIINGN